MKKLFTLLVLATLLSCSSNDDPENCIPIVCQNAGISNADCGCDCPDGFAGNDCSVKIEPTRMFITSIRVVQFPNLNPAGNSWDFALSPNDRPDIYPVLSNPTQTEIYFVGQTLNNAVSGTNNQISYAPATPIQINNVNAPLILALFDEDANSSRELMDAYSFFIYEPSMTGFPAKLLLQNPASELKFELSVTYQW